MNEIYESKIIEILDVVCKTSNATIKEFDFSAESAGAIKGLIDGTTEIQVDVDGILKKAYAVLASNADFLAKDDFRNSFAPELIKSFELQIEHQIGSDHTDARKSIDELQKYIEVKANCVDVDNRQLQKVKDFLLFCKEKADEFANEHCDTSKFDYPNADEKAATQSEWLDDNDRGLKRLEADFANAAKLVKKAGEQAEKAGEQANSAKQQANSAKQQANLAKTRADSIMPNMLTVLGIFVAVIIAVVACYLNILLTNQAKEAVILSAKHPVQVVVFLYFLMGHVMLSVIFFLMYLISKLTTFRLASYCHKFETTEGSDEKKRESEMRCDCRECKEKKNCGPLPRLWKRYPYFVGYNSAFLIIYVAILFCAA